VSKKSVGPNVAAAVLQELRVHGYKTRELATLLGVSTARLEKAEKTGATTKIVDGWLGMLWARAQLKVRYKIHPDNTVWVGITEKETAA
jgi:hypothetical protein